MRNASLIGSRGKKNREESGKDRDGFSVEEGDREAAEERWGGWSVFVCLCV